MDAWEQFRNIEIEDVAEIKATIKSMEASLRRMEATFSKISTTLTAIEQKLDKLLSQ